MTRKLLSLLYALTVSIATPALAHTVWIEPAEGKLVARFAEPGKDFETSPGYLDNLSAPLAFKIITNAPVTIDSPKKADHFLLTGAVTTNIACLETTFTVRGGRKPHFYARWLSDGAEAGIPLLTLDLVPSGKAGEVRAWFRGRPLNGIKATLRTPDQKESEITADNEGFLRFEPKQSGQYLLTIAHHREPLAGFHRGVAYKETSHNAALTWRQVE